MKKLIITMFATAVFLFNAGVKADPLNMEMSLVPSYCTESFGMMNFELKNKTDKWLEVEAVSVSFGDASTDQKIFIVSGERLVAWNNAITTKVENDAFFRRLLIGALGGISAGLAKNNGSELGKFTSLAAAGMISLGEISAIKDKINVGAMLPSSHLLSGKIIIPPDLYVNKWLLVNTSKSADITFLTDLVVTLILKDYPEITKNITFRKSTDTFCSWQSNKAEVEF